MILEILVQPRANRNEVAGIHGDRLKIRVTAPPVEGKANEQIIKLLAKVFGVPKSHVMVLCGARSRNKRIGVRNPCIYPDWMKR